MRKSIRYITERENLSESRDIRKGRKKTFRDNEKEKQVTSHSKENCIKKQKKHTEI